MNRTIAMSVPKLIALLIVGGVAFAAGRSEAGPSPHMFGMFGLVMGQTARLNVVSVDDPNIRPENCMVELSFLDSMGEMVGESMRVDLMRGHAAFLDFSPADLEPRPEGRFQLRALVRAIDDPNAKRNKCMVVPTGEVYDNNTMKTMFLFGLTPVGMVDPGDMPAPGR